MQLDKKVIFFCAGANPTDDTGTDEAGQIARLRTMYGTVVVRNAAVRNTYGTSITDGGVSDAVGSGRLEPADALAGTIPAAYKTASGNTIVDTALYPDGEITVTATDGPNAAIITPASASIAANGGTAQLSAVVAEVDDETGVTTLTNKSSGTGVTWTSGTPAKATVSSAGLVTGANSGAATVVITYAYEDADGNEVTATRNVTVT